MGINSTTLNKAIVIRFDHADDMTLWTSVDVVKSQSMIESDGSDDYGIISKTHTYKSDNFLTSDLQSRVAPKIWNFLVANPYVSA